MTTEDAFAKTTKTFLQKVKAISTDSFCATAVALRDIVRDYTPDGDDLDGISLRESFTATVSGTGDEAIFAEIGDIIVIGSNLRYAPAVEFGTRYTLPHAMVQRTLLDASNIADSVIQEIAKS
ncbi:MAG: hypothetical protein ABT940_09095 [Alphaproteobacteria bacterium]